MLTQLYSVNNTRLTRFPRGFKAELARREDVSRSLVTRVLRGQATSKRITRAAARLLKQWHRRKRG